MSREFVRIDDAAGCRTVTLDRVGKANALTAAMMQALGEAMAPSGSGLHVLRSASPRLFCAGADIAEFAAGADSLRAQEHALLQMIDRLSSSGVPMVAIARGKASGAGAVLLALADVVIAAEDLEIACPEIRFGMFPVMVEAVLRSRIAPALAARVCFGHALDARAARDVGLATDVLPVADFEESAAQRLDFYRDRIGALQAARDSRLRLLPPGALAAQVRDVAPLMARNFARPGVRENILGYLSGLGRDARSPGGKIDKSGPPV